MLGKKFLPAVYGHCKKRNFKRAFQQEEIKDCHYWEAAEIKTENCQKTVYAILNDIDEKLNVVINILSFYDMR